MELKLNITTVIVPSVSDGNLTLEYRAGVLTSYCDFCEPFSNWTAIKTSAPTNGIVASVWIPPVNGTYEVRALWGVDATHEASRSTTLDVQVYTNPTSTFNSTTSTTSTAYSNITSTTTLGSLTTTSSRSITTSSSSIALSSSAYTQTSTITSMTQSASTIQKSTTSSGAPSQNLNYVLYGGLAAVAFVAAGVAVFVLRKK